MAPSPAFGVYTQKLADSQKILADVNNMLFRIDERLNGVANNIAVKERQFTAVTQKGALTLKLLFSYFGLPLAQPTVQQAPPAQIQQQSQSQPQPQPQPQPQAQPPAEPEAQPPAQPQTTLQSTTTETV